MNNQSMKDNNSGQQPVKTKEEVIKEVMARPDIVTHYDAIYAAMDEWADIKYASQFREGQQSAYREEQESNGILLGTIVDDFKNQKETFIPASSKTFDTLRIEQHKRRMELEKENEELKDAIKSRNILQEEDKAEIERLKGLLKEAYIDYCVQKYGRIDIPLSQEDNERMWEKYTKENNL